MALRRSAREEEPKPAEFEISEPPSEAAKQEENSEIAKKPTPQKQSPGTEKRNGTKVFSEIFMEESDADIRVLDEAIKGLAAGNRSDNEKFLREIKNACSSIYSSAELFSYSQISEFVALLGSTADSAVKSEFELSESLIALFAKVPDVLRGMITAEPDADEAADAIMEKLATVMELVRDGDTKTATLERVVVEEPDSGDGDEIEESTDMDQHEGELVTSETETEEEDEPSHVKYFDKLF